jgi:hypothetical protein
LPPVAPEGGICSAGTVWGTARFGGTGNATSTPGNEAIGEHFLSRNQPGRNYHDVAVFDELVVQLAALRVLAATLRRFMSYGQIARGTSPAVRWWRPEGHLGL